MSRLQLVPTDLLNLASDPTTPTLRVGDMYFNTTNNEIRVYTGSAWVRAAFADNTLTLTNKTISGSSNTLSNIPNSALTNSTITINGSAVALGGSTTVTSATDWTPALLLGGM